MPTCQKEIDAMLMTAVGLMAQANAEIRAAQERHQVQRAEDWRRGRPIAFIDGLINDLEMLNLKRVSRVPISYENRLGQLRVLLSDTAVASGQLEKLRTRIGIAKLMDALYAIQEVLFAQSAVSAGGTRSEDWFTDSYVFVTAVPAG
jgi:hypothetical protein